MVVIVIVVVVRVVFSKILIKMLLNFHLFCNIDANPGNNGFCTGIINILPIYGTKLLFLPFAPTNDFRLSAPDTIRVFLYYVDHSCYSYRLYLGHHCCCQYCWYSAY